MKTNESKKPTHIAYTVTGEGENQFWNRIGAVWPHEDGEGFNVQLSSLPIDGKLVVRIAKEKKKAQED